MIEITSLQAMVISCMRSWAIIWQYSRRVGCYIKLRFLQHFMSEQIDLHIFEAITAASCVDNIINSA